MKQTERKPPKHLGPEGRSYWRAVERRFALEEHHYAVLQAACEAKDRAAEARELIASQGMLIGGDGGRMARANPLLRVERDAWTAFLRAEKQLGLDVDAPSEFGGR